MRRWSTSLAKMCAKLGKHSICLWITQNPYIIEEAFKKKTKTFAYTIVGINLNKTLYLLGLLQGKCLLRCKHGKGNHFVILVNILVF
jgi:hypothetical protein